MELEFIKEKCKSVIKLQAKSMTNQASVSSNSAMPVPTAHSQKWVLNYTLCNNLIFSIFNVCVVYLDFT